MSLSLSSSIDDPNLLTAVEQLISAHPESVPVIQRLIAYYDAKLGIPDSEGREHKKRRTDMTSTLNTQTVQAAILDVSFQIPARKRYNLILTQTQLCLINPKTNDQEYSYSLRDFELGACVPIPGAAANKGGDTYALFLKTPETDPVVFSIQHKGPLVIQRDGVESTIDADKKRETAVIELLTTRLDIQITIPDRQVYRSTLVSSTTGKPSEEDKFHANAYLKAKDGSLYFLPQGILYGFKKPTLFFPFSCIASTHYCGIMQHTFNLALILQRGRRPLGSTFAGAAASNNKDDVGETTVEFSMIEQSEYGGIDAYIKKIGINDKSMSEELRAPEVKTKGMDPSTENATHQDDDDEEDEESDHDFHPSDDDEDPLEYDSEAGSSDDMEAAEEEGDDDDDEQEEEHLASAAARNDAEVDLEQASGSELVEGASEQDALVSEDEDEDEEQDITRTDNETEDDNELGEEELDEEDEDEELAEFEDDDDDDVNDDDDRSESLGSSSDQDIDEDMHDASIGDDAKDELDDSD